MTDGSFSSTSLRLLCIDVRRRRAGSGLGSLVCVCATIQGWRSICSAEIRVPGLRSRARAIKSAASGVNLPGRWYFPVRIRAYTSSVPPPSNGAAPTRHSYASTPMAQLSTSGPYPLLFSARNLSLMALSHRTISGAM